MKQLLLLAILLPNLVLGQVTSRTINSSHLGRRVQVFYYDAVPSSTKKPAIYLTDGKKFIDNGGLDSIISLTLRGSIPPAYYVFVSSYDVDDSSIDYRNEYFFSNPDYIAFFEQELIPAMEKMDMGKSFTPYERLLVGISFGGLNAAYFSAKSVNLFQNFALLSPVTYPRPAVLQDIVFSQNRDLRIFLSTGQNDAEKYVAPLKSMYSGKGYTIKLLHTDGGHDFENWNSQLKQLINFFFPSFGDE